MIATLLPPSAVAVESRGDGAEGFLFPEEEDAVRSAVAKRRDEFVAGRACARLALERLGVAPLAIPSGERGAPRWPVGFVGSITHCAGYCAAAVARDEELLTIGIDAEPHGPLPERVLGDIARAEEMDEIAALGSRAPTVRWDRLLFSAKESVFKAWYPLARSWLGFEDCRLAVDPAGGSFRVTLLGGEPASAHAALNGAQGRWVVRDELVLTALAVARGG
jgi:4'-phosphopantetheinyl transferase EntD